MPRQEHFEQYSEYEPYTDSIRDAEFDFWVRGLQRSEWSITHMDLAHLHVQFGVEGGGQITDGNTRPDGWAFFFQMTGDRMQVNGNMLPRDAALLIAPGDKFHLSSDGPHNWYSVFIANALLFESSQDIASAVEKNDSSRIVTLDSTQILNVGRLGEYMTGTQTQRAAITQEQLVTAGKKMLELPGRFPRKMGRRPENRVKLLSAAASFIETAPRMNPTVPEIAHYCEVSERTLRNVFGSYFGVAPREFVMLWRLHACRRELRNGPRSTGTVNAIASAHGFTDFGRFAKYYRDLFLERPSETLQRT